MFDDGDFCSQIILLKILYFISMLKLCQMHFNLSRAESVLNRHSFLRSSYPFQ